MQSSTRQPYETLQDQIADREASEHAIDWKFNARTLNLGCGVRPMKDAINHDRIKHAEHVDFAWDLNLTPWPMPDARFSRIVALDVFEHLKVDIGAWMAECHRILETGGELVLRVAAWNNPVSYRDPTHERFFHDETFDYFDPSKQLYRDYGAFYYPDGPRFTVVTISRGNADPRYGVGDICAVLRKV